MASKTHCDVCDGTNSATSGFTETVRIDGPNNQLHDVRVDIHFNPRYTGDDEPRKDLCRDCTRNVFAALFEKYGGQYRDRGERDEHGNLRTASDRWPDGAPT